MLQLKRKFYSTGGFSLIIVVILVAVVAVGAFGLFNTQYATKRFGGTYTETLSPNVKLVNVTWKENNLWILTRPMRPEEKAEVYTLRESSVLGILEGTVTIKESKNPSP